MSDSTPLVVRQVAPPPLTGFVRGLSLFDCVTVVASAMVGSAIFIAPAPMRKADCDGAAPYGNKILAVAPDDALRLVRVRPAYDPLSRPACVTRIRFT